MNKTDLEQWLTANNEGFGNVQLRIRQVTSLIKLGRRIVKTVMVNGLRTCGDGIASLQFLIERSGYRGQQDPK